jgi:hypothetical protein
LEEACLVPDDNATGEKVWRVFLLPQFGQSGFQPEALFTTEANDSNSILHFPHKFV